VPGKTAEERLKYMVGQLILTGFSGRQPDEPDVERVIHDVRDGKISGVIVRDSNVAGFQQLRGLLMAVANAGGDAPPLLAIDQPGGPDTVLPEEKGFAFYGSASSVSGGGSAYEAQLLYRAMAGELAALGVNFNIGPSEDACREDGVNLSAFCFGATPSRIAAFARAFNFGHHDRGVLTALRHAPFRSGLRSSWMNERASSAILHLLVRGEASDALIVRVKAMEPAALMDVAFAWRQKKARASGGRRAGFDGALIVELDMGPGGAPIRYDEAILRAFQAGADMVLVREPASIPAGIYNVSLDAVRAGVKSGRLPAARIVEAYKHVQRLKARLRAFPSRTRVAGLDQPEAVRAPGAR
jgi:beta-N-acetylhexosaminidase